MKKIKRSDIAANLKNTDRISELSRELTMRAAVYSRQVQEKKLSNYEANKRYLIILEQKELLQLCDRKGIQLPELLKLINELPDRQDRGRQQKLSLI